MVITRTKCIRTGDGMPPQRQKRRSKESAAGQRVNVQKRILAIKRAEGFRTAYRKKLNEDPKLLRLFLKNPRDVDRLIASGRVSIDFPGAAAFPEKTIKNYRLGCIGGNQILEPLKVAPPEAAKMAEATEAQRVVHQERIAGLEPKESAAAGQRVNLNVVKSASARQAIMELRESYRRTLAASPALQEIFRKNPSKVDELIATGMVPFEFPGGKRLPQKTIKNCRLGCIGGRKREHIGRLTFTPQDAARLEAAKVQRAAPREMIVEPDVFNRVVKEFNRHIRQHDLAGKVDRRNTVGRRVGLAPEDVQRIVDIAIEKGLIPKKYR
jgi:hypothetical protein